jgi:hypothetical protein
LRLVVPAGVMFPCNAGDRAALRLAEALLEEYNTQARREGIPLGLKSADAFEQGKAPRV